MNTEAQSKKYNLFIKRLQQLRLGDFIALTSAIGIKGNHLANEVITLPNNIYSDPFKINKLVKIDMFKLKMYQFVSYAKMNHKDPLMLFKTYKTKYKQLLIRDNGEYMTTIADSIQTSKTLRQITFIKIGGETIAKMSFPRGISIQVHAENNKLIFKSFPW